MTPVGADGAERATVDTMAYVKSDENAFVVKTYDASMGPLRDATVASLAPKPPSERVDPEAEAMMREGPH